jgi:hypothetical protein
MRDIRTTLRRPMTLHTKVVGGERKIVRRHGGTELQRAVADMIDLRAAEHVDGIEGALHEFLTADPVHNFDRTIAPAVRRGGGQASDRARFFQTFFRRYQMEIPVLVHAIGLGLDLSREAQSLAAVYATAHYLATLNGVDLPRPDYAKLAKG